MIVDHFNRRALIAKVRERKASAQRIGKFRCNLDPGFESFEAEDFKIAGGALDVHVGGTKNVDDPILDEAVAQGLYVQISIVEARHEL